ncbi:nuclear transport factor 2 family protein [Limnohabitans sp. Hippo3]|uniref:nuclear transport factor 2 family protein n=1 Tax=Limnohabitans sp. Hippo3 TaxID=1597956 RepID=UPI000D39E335|nr:nuclear transport factor 2 family protein [Limnohabitans sp. Hippo3]PUE38731.1 isomerase [Limnohabitans sp. Hippo3]
MDTRQATQNLAAFFETLSPHSVAQLHTVYDAQAIFKDPFNEVQGLPEIERIFRHMYEALDQPHFVVTGQVVDGLQAFLTWEFRFRFKRFDTTTLQTVRGASHVLFNEQGLVTMHRDYWDAAEELYEKLPVVGAVMRWLKARANQA